jgi:hypothetical protein
MAKLDRDNAFFGYKAPVVPIVDEQTKKAGAAAALAASSPASLAAAAASRASWAADADPYTTALVGNTGKTQAQLDVAQGAADTAKMITDLYGSQGITSKVDPVTGKVITKSSTGAVLGSPNQTPIGTPNPVVPKVVPKVEAKEISDATKDAFAMLTDLFNSYGLESLAGEIADYMSKGFTASEALIKLKTNPSGAYATRFAGNFARVNKGLNALSEAAYIDLENSYTNTLKSYGLSNMLGMDSKSNWKTFANYIANDISALEFKDRIGTVQDRVVNADPATKELFKKWYPSLTDKDLVAYFLNPTETIGKLKEKVTTAEIGAAFMGQNLSTDMTSASDLARYGIDRAGAILGASQIAEVLPEASKLGNIYEEAGITYSQKTGEEEFLKSSDEAKRKRTRLASMERGSFSASAGNAPGAYSTGYLKKSSAAGQI